MTMLRRSSGQNARTTPIAKPTSEQHAADDHAGQWPEQGHGVRRPATAKGKGCVPVGAEQGPRVVGVDAQIRVAAGGLGHLVPEADDVEREGRQQQQQDDERDDRRGHDAQRTLFAGQPAPDRGQAPRQQHIVPRRGAGAQQVAAQQDHAHDWQQDDAELRLDQCGEHREQGGALRVAAHQGRHREQRDQCADGVGLAPDRRVVPGHRVEQVDGRGDERQAAGVAAWLDARCAVRDRAGSRPRCRR